jgi:3-dehydroquinate synthase|tara:strand:- start:17516 stop:18634 length:1119 start_codon:yes stop_codon:yes gene_type:complete
MLWAGNCKMEEIRVRIQSRRKDYSIFISDDILPLLASFIKKSHRDKRVVIITEDNVKSLYGKKILNALKSVNPYLISVPEGEASKTRETKQKIEDMLLEKRFGRDTVIIVFGGGVIGDLAGFTASTFNRGVPATHVPTTLLAMVDSSVGGKTAVDTKHGKNLIGSIYQPDAVFTELDFLDTLPKEEFLNGMAEVIKIAITSDKKLFSFIEKNNKQILAKEKQVLLHIIKRSIELKRDVVEKDEKESGLRQILNFGHTFGHALEACSNYKIKHGYCISLGIVVETKIAASISNLKQEEKRIISLLDNFNLPVKLKKDIDENKIIEIMKVDKKARNQKPMFVILKEIGKIKTENNNFSFEIKEDVIKKVIEASK